MMMNDRENMNAIASITGRIGGFPEKLEHVEWKRVEKSELFW